MKRKLPIVLVCIDLILVFMLAFGIFWNRHYIFVDNRFYPRDATYLDLTHEAISIDYYQKLHAILPNCEINWMVPFQGQRYAKDTKTLKITDISDEEMTLLYFFPDLETVAAEGCRNYDQLQKLKLAYPNVKVTYTVLIDGKEYDQDATDITIANLTAEDSALLEYLPRLSRVNAQGCTDYAQLKALQEHRPTVDVRYSVPLFGVEYPVGNTTKLDLKNPDVSQLVQQLQYLPHVETVLMEEPEATGAELKQMLADFPNVHFTWTKTVLGITFSSEDQEIDFSDMPLTTDDVEAAMSYFPNAEKVIMSNCGIDNETMAAFREKMRPEYKVVWTVIVTRQKVRTDDTIFHSSGRGVSLIDEQSKDLFYCEDMIVVDVGHSMIKTIEWVEGMPNLKYLILADNWLKDISPISSCKNLVYLELFINNHLKDISPLIGCTALEDVSVANTYVDLEPFAQMPWLKNLWCNNCHITKEVRQLLTESLPNTHIEFDHGFTTGGGWRELQNYYDMRELMGLPCNHW